MTRTLAALAAALIATTARAQTPPPALPPSSTPPPAAAPGDEPAPPAPAAALPAPVAPAPKKEEKKKGTFVIGPKSQISIAGRAWGEVNNVRANKGAATTGKPVQNLTRVSSNSSYLRVSGERELDYGFKALAQVEAEVGFDGENGLPFSSTRNTFVGLSSPYGELTLGKFDSPVKETTIGRDPFVGTGIFGYYNTFTGYRADRRMNNAVMYETPSLGGVTVMGAFSLGEAKFVKVTKTQTVNDTAGGTAKISSTSTGTIRVDPYIASGAIHYRSGPLFVGVGYEWHNDCGNPDADAPGGPNCDRAFLGTDAQPRGVDQIFRAGAEYTVKTTFTRLAAVYDHQDSRVNALNGAAKGTLRRDAYWGSLTQGLFGNRHQLILNYGQSSKFSGTPGGSTAGASYDKTDAWTYTAAYRFNFDSDLMLYAAVAQIVNGDNQGQKFGSGGVPGFSAPAGSRVTGFGAGVRYLF